MASGKGPLYAEEQWGLSISSSEYEKRSVEPVCHLATVVISSLRSSQRCDGQTAWDERYGSLMTLLNCWMNRPSWLSLRWGNKLIFKSIWACKRTNFNGCHFFLVKPKPLFPDTFTYFFSMYVNPVACPKQNSFPFSTISVSTLPRLGVLQLFFCFSLGRVMSLSHDLSSIDLFLFAVSPPYVRSSPLHGDMIPHSVSRDLLIPLWKRPKCVCFWSNTT